VGAIRLAYPKIPGSKNCPAGRCVAFEKYDGTNLHWVWERGFGWISFGTRRDSFSFDDRGAAEFAGAHPGLDEAPRVFARELAPALEEIFNTHPGYAAPELTVFTEFFGPRSFAGMHRPDDPKELVLFDVQTPEGIVGPERFVRDFAGLKTARVVYRGKLTGRFAEDVREGKYGVGEGVVCKGGAGGADLWMVKIKTYAYLEKLRQAFKDRWEDYWE
jgi:RNA ligase-like protein